MDIQLTDDNIFPKNEDHQNWEEGKEEKGECRICLEV